MGWDAQVTADDIDKQRIALGGPDRGGVANGPQQDACNPEPKTRPKRRCERTI
jgi:hypothetical protein